MKFIYENKERDEYKRIREEHKKNASKERLNKIAQQKIRTTMIGAIATLEKYLPSLKEDNSELFYKIREEILDKGNNQIRNFQNELQQYDIIWNKHKIMLPFKERKNNESTN